MSRLRTLALAVALALALAGCAKKDEPVATSAVLPGFVSGTVTDVALTPLAGVDVTVEGANASAKTDATGAFRFELPPGEYLLLAQLEGHKPAALRALVASEQTAALAFALEALPATEPSSMAQEGKGLLGCHALVVVGGEGTGVPCGAQDPNERTRLEFVVDTVAELGGAVVELVWEPGSAAGKTLQLSVSRGGEEPVLLGATEGEGHVALPIPARLLEGLRAGETLVADVAPAGSVTDEEAGLDASVVAQQAFTVYVTLFYRQEPPAGYTALESA